jgi:hypothetical protein
MTLVTTDTDLSRMLQNSVEFETVKKHLGKMLDEWEGQWIEGTTYSDASKEEYIDAALYMRKQGRRGDIADKVKETLYQ